MMFFIGIGNDYAHDDAAGLVMARRLKLRAPNGVRIAEHSGEGTSLMSLWEKEKRVILCDAVSSGKEPGTIFRFDVNKKKIPATFFRYSTHAFSAAEAIELARTLKRLPEQMIFYGIEGKNFQAGIGLSVEVEESVKRLVGHIPLEYVPARRYRI